MQVRIILNASNSDAAQNKKIIVRYKMIILNRKKNTEFNVKLILNVEHKIIPRRSLTHCSVTLLRSFRENGSRDRIWRECGYFQNNKEK